MWSLSQREDLTPSKTARSTLPLYPGLPCSFHVNTGQPAVCVCVFTVQSVSPIRMSLRVSLSLPLPLPLPLPNIPDTNIHIIMDNQLCVPLCVFTVRSVSPTCMSLRFSLSLPLPKLTYQTLTFDIHVRTCTHFQN